MKYIEKNMKGYKSEIRSVVKTSYFFQARLKTALSAAPFEIQTKFSQFV